MKPQGEGWEISVDIEFLVELVFGMLGYRILSRYAPLNRRFADQLTDAVLTQAQWR